MNATFVENYMRARYLRRGLQSLTQRGGQAAQLGRGLGGELIAQQAAVSLVLAEGLFDLAAPREQAQQGQARRVLERVERYGAARRAAPMASCVRSSPS